jgi:lipoate-protein ligase A
MKYLDLTLPTPAENLACDEVLLDLRENQHGEEILRFWEPQTHFVVVGHANQVSTEVNTHACKARNLPILRRCSGGGTVLQGPGCLNYALILKISQDGPLRSIVSANRFVLERNRATLDELLRARSQENTVQIKLPSDQRQGQPAAHSTRPILPSSKPGPYPTPSIAATPPERLVSIQGNTDLAMDGLKISGNAQRRKKEFLLFHGTFLLQFDLSLIPAVLPMPSKQPAYRQCRPHRDFLANLTLPPDSVKAALRQAWRAFEPLEDVPLDTIAFLARNKYETGAWNLKF